MKGLFQCPPEEEGLREKVELPLERETEGFEKIPLFNGKKRCQ